MRIFQDLGLTYADLLTPLFVAVTAAIFMVFAWKWTNGFAVWASLKLRGYHEREEVYLNGSRAIITKIGFMTTTFLILNGEGLVMRWAAVSNLTLDSQRIERISLRLKVLEKIDPTNKEDS